MTTTGSAALLLDAFDRVREVVHGTVDGLTEDQLAHRPDGRGNSIGWLVWHLTRVQDDHVAEVAGAEQVWTAKGFASDFGLPFVPQPSAGRCPQPPPPATGTARPRSPPSA